MSFRVALLLLIASASATEAIAQTVNDLPPSGQIGSLERWMISNKVDADTVQAMRICESNVVMPSNPPALGTAIPYASDWAKSCAAIRKKMYDAAVAAAVSKTTTDKSFVDDIAKR